MSIFYTGFYRLKIITDGNLRCLRLRLFAGTSQQFLQDTIQNQIAEKLRLSFFNYFRYYPSPSEINSWRNSLRAVSQVFQYANLVDQGIILEYQLPLTSKRLDCLICGKNADAEDNAVIIELKQWDKCEEASGESPSIQSTSGLSIKPKNCLA